MIVSFEEMRRVATGLWVGPMAAEDVRILPGAPLQGVGRHLVQRFHETTPITSVA